MPPFGLSTGPTGPAAVGGRPNRALARRGPDRRAETLPSGEGPTERSGGPIYRGGPGECIEIEPPEEGGRYSTGADWAKERDWTVIATIRSDVQPARLVAYERIARMPWPMMVERFDRRATRYEGTAAFDATGIGNVVSDLLTVGAKPVVLVGRARADLLTRYLVAVEGGQIEAPRIEHPYGEHRFATVDDVFGNGHPNGTYAECQAQARPAEGPGRHSAKYR